MPKSRVLRSDPIRKTRLVMHEVPHENQFVLEEQQDVTDIVEMNKARDNLFDSAKNEWGEYGDLVGRIPVQIWNDLVRSGIAMDDDALKKWLDDPDNRVWKVRPGSLSR